MGARENKCQILALIFSVHMDKVLVWPRFRKVYVLKASFSKNFLQVTDINFPSTISSVSYTHLTLPTIYSV